MGDKFKLVLKIEERFNAGNAQRKVFGKIKGRPNKNIEVIHPSGVKGMKWGVRNGPPYPIKNNGKVAKVRGHDNIVEEAIRSGEVSKTVNKDKQKRHTKSDHLPGRSYLDGDIEYAQKLVDKYGGKGIAILDKHKNWTRKEKFDDSNIIGTHVDPDGTETRTNKGVIAYSKTGTHVYPRKERK